jgi:hypothetical protein
MRALSTFSNSLQQPPNVTSFLNYKQDHLNLLGNYATMVSQLSSQPPPTPSNLQGTSSSQWTINMHQPVPLDNFHFNYLPFVQSQQEKSQQETQQRNLLRSSQSQHTVLSIQSQQEKSRQETQHTALFASTAVAARVAFLHAVCFSPAIST